jgi:predicted amidohydrolase
MKVAAIQHDIVWQDAPATLAAVTPMIAEAAAAGARLIVLTEMFATGFSMQPELIAEDEGGPIETFLVDEAGRHDVHLLASIAQRGPDGRYRNNAVLARPDGTIVRYAKIHPFSYAREDEHYAAGDRFVTVDVDGVRTSIFVCYDLRFADEFWALAVHTDLYVVVANWPESRREHWRALLRARAIENQAYVLATNRVGEADGLCYQGDSAIIDPMGGTLAEAVPGAVEIIYSDVETAVVQATRARFPFLADRRS